MSGQTQANTTKDIRNVAAAGSRQHGKVTCREHALCHRRHRTQGKVSTATPSATRRRGDLPPDHRFQPRRSRGAGRSKINVSTAPVTFDFVGDVLCALRPPSRHHRVSAKDPARERAWAPAFWKYVKNADLPVISSSPSARRSTAFIQALRP
jgi:hypothetical protein